MATFKQRIGIGNPDRSHFEEVEALIDTGATPPALPWRERAGYTWLPRSILERLGHSPSLSRRLPLADGRIIEREGPRSPFASPGRPFSPSASLTMAVTLEEFGLGVDTINQQLVPRLTKSPPSAKIPFD